MADEIYIVVYTNGGSISQTTDMKLSDKVVDFWNAVLKVVKPDTDYVAKSGEHVKASVSGADTTISLPAFVSGQTQVNSVMKVDATAKDVIVDCDDGKKINGSASITLTTQYENKKFIQDSTTGDWEIW